MRNKTLPRVAQVLGFIFALAILPSAHALQITMTLPDCPTPPTRLSSHWPGMPSARSSRGMPDTSRRKRGLRC